MPNSARRNRPDLIVLPGDGIDRDDDARLLDRAIDLALTEKRTADLAEDGKETVSTVGMGDAVPAAASLDGIV